LLTLVLAATSPAAAITRYVDKGSPACLDTGPGTAATPYCNITPAAKLAQPGDVVQVGTGTYLERVSIARSGTEAAPVTFTAAPGASPVVKGGSYGFYMSAKSWIVIQGFTVTNTVGYGIYAKDSSHIVVTNNHVTLSGQPVDGGTRSGIYLYNTSDSVVADCLVNYNSDAGIKLNYGATRNWIGRNVAHHNARGYVRAAPGFDIRSGGNTIEANIAHHNEDTGIQIYAGAQNNLVVRNVTYDNGDHGIDVSKSPNQRIIGNTVYRNVAAGINVEGASTGVTVMNNLAVDNGIASPRTHGNIRVDSTSTIGTTLDYNVYNLTAVDTMVIWASKSYKTLDAMRLVSGQEAHGLQADPLWMDAPGGDFRLAAGSPAIDSANADASGQTPVDVEGLPRVDDPATPDTGAGARTYDDRGAHEYQPPAPVEPAP
jgi:parallel beta-helix repeat protein